MATELIETGASAAASSDITVADGASATVFLKDADGGPMDYEAKAVIEIKDSDGAYTTIGMLDPQTPSCVIAGAGTYRVRRLATGASVGVEQG